MDNAHVLDCAVYHIHTIYFEEIRVFRACTCTKHISGIMHNDCCCTCLVLRAAIMDDRNIWWHSNFAVRGEILGFAEDELPRKHLPGMFSFIKNYS